MAKKVKIPVYIQTVAYKHIGDVEIELPGEFDDAAYELWKSMGFDYPRVNVSNDFELNDEWELPEEDVSFYFEQEEK